ALPRADRWQLTRERGRSLLLRCVLLSPGEVAARGARVQTSTGPVPARTLGVGRTLAPGALRPPPRPQPACSRALRLHRSPLPERSPDGHERTGRAQSPPPSERGLAPADVAPVRRSDVVKSRQETSVVSTSAPAMTIRNTSPPAQRASLCSVQQRCVAGARHTVVTAGSFRAGTSSAARRTTPKTTAN